MRDQDDFWVGFVFMSFLLGLSSPIEYMPVFPTKLGLLRMDHSHSASW